MMEKAIAHSLENGNAEAGTNPSELYQSGMIRLLAYFLSRECIVLMSWRTNIFLNFFYFFC